VDKKKQSRHDIRRIRKARRALKALLEWHRDNGRHDLPWRRDHDPYAVLVSEFMLQQTTVATVMPRFLSWMRLFPTIADLAAASEQEVLAAWEGLGYYSRARRLHAAAEAIVERHGGCVPSAEEDLLALPGIGSYTAAAIRAFAHDKPAVVLDTNIIRVLARWGTITAPIDTAIGRNALLELATSFFPDEGCRAVASALMDLGATVCTSGKPDCDACPLRRSCAAESPERLPAKSPRKVTTNITEHRAWVFLRGKLHLEHSSGPRWKGLWILPELGERKPTGRTVAELTYPITRYRVTMKVYPVKTAPLAGLQGFSVADLAALPIPSPHRKAIGKALRAVAAG
jgi:A/G-specific adenine glycosylase